LEEDANFGYEYNFNGNLTRKTNKPNSAFTLYEYDAENKLIRVVREDGSIVNYKYDGLGRRIEKEVDGVVTRFIYDDYDLLLELDGSNNIVARYTHGIGLDEPLILEKAGQSFFYLADDLGSITEITDNNAAVVQSYSYSSFGKIGSQMDPAFIQPFAFTGREFDQETGLYFYRERYYDAGIGRFLQEDSLGIDPAWLAGAESNQYAYVANDPINNTDPFGLFNLPADPSGLPKGWQLDPSDPQGKTYTHPKEPGRGLRFERGDPRSPNIQKQRDHWHDKRPGEKTRQGRWHRYPGEEVPNPGEDLRRRPGRRPPAASPVPPPGFSLICPLPLFIPNAPLFIEQFLAPGGTGGGT